MEKNFDIYIKNLKEIIKRYILIISKEISSDLPEDLIDEIIRLLNDILKVKKKINQKNYLKVFYNELPIKRIEYLAAALIYLILNYKENANKIKISRFAQIIELARQNIRRVLNYLASFKGILEKYKLSYNPRVTYQFDESNYINQIQLCITKFYYQLVKDLNIQVKNREKQLEEIMNIVNDAISSVKKSNKREILITFYNSLDKRVRDLKYLAAVVCYIYFRFLEHKYIEQEEFVKVLNKIDNLNLTFDSFSRTYSNFSQNHFLIEQELYYRKIFEWLDTYITKINKSSKLPLELTEDFKNRALEIFDKAIENGFNIQELSKDKYAFAQSKKFLPKFIAACLVYLTLKSYKELEDFATRDYMKEFLKMELDYSRITSNQSPLYNYVSEFLGRYKFQPYSIEEFKRILRKYIGFYNRINNPHHESVLLLKIFSYSKLKPSEFAKKLNIHGGDSKNLLQIVTKMINFEDFSVLRKIKEFIQLYIPQDNRKKAIQAYKEYRELWNQISHIGKSEEICRKIFESIFKTPFKKSYPKWLKSKKGGQMHLDGYNSELKIAFEYQGKQHYYFTRNWHKTRDIFLQRQVDDKWKKKLCNEKKIILIEVPYRVKYEDMRDYIIIECKKKGILISSNEIETSEFNQSKFSLKAFEKFKEYNPKSNSEINEEENKENVEKESSKEEKEASESFKDKNHDTIITENKQEHPFERRFNEVEEEEEFNDPYLWISPKILENIEKNKEKLLEKARERSVRYTDSLSGKESLNYFEKDDLETEPKNSFIKESSKENFVENQPLINPEIGIEPAHYMQHQKEPLPDMGRNYIPEKSPEKPIEKPIDEPPEKPPEKPIDEPPEKPPEKPIDEPPEKPIDEPPEKPIDDPPEKPPEKPIDDPPEKPPEKPIDDPPEKPPEKPIDDPPEKPPEKPIDDPLEKPPEKPIDEPPEKPPEKPIDEPPEKPPEKPIDDPPEMPPEMPPTSIIGVGLPGEVGVSIISTIEVPQFADFSSSLESPTEEENFDDDIENVGNKESYEEENLDDDIENLDNIDEDNDFNENFDGTVLDDLESNENDDIYNSPDDPINYIDIGEYVPEAEADSSYGYSDCPDDCPSE